MNRLVPALEQARENRGRKIKVQAIAEAFVAVGGDDEELATAARFVSGRLLPDRAEGVLGVGYALVVSAVVSAYGVSSTELQARARSLGDLGDAVGALAPTAPGVHERPGLGLAEVADLGRALETHTDRTTKGELLTAAFAKARPDEARYLTKVLLGELRIGVASGIVEEAIASAFERDVNAVRAAAILCPDPGELAVLARHDELAEAAFVVGSPIAFMLASPIETVKAPLDAARTAWEDKLDGVRVQVHARPGLVRLFARGGGDVSAVFPEVRRALERVPRAIVLDGEILAIAAWAEGDHELRPRPFQALQARLNRVDPDASVLASTPVALFAFDLLFDGESILALAWEARRARLEALFNEVALAPVAQPTRAHPFDATLALDPQIDAAYAEARRRGHEGIVLKSLDAPYEAGRRGSAWRKVKRALATLDVVITRAELGHGKRAKVLSDYTFAVWNGEALVDVGKAYSGLTDVEIAELTRVLEATTIEEQGGQRFVTPTVVLEVAFDGLQPSKRHASGFALRFPRIARIRSDKRPADADTLGTVRALWEAQVASGHREQEAPAPPKQKAATKKGAREAEKPAQLGLFGADAATPRTRPPSSPGKEGGA